MARTLTIVQPDDWHHHFRDDARLPVVAPLAAAQFGRAIAMPNIVPPVTTTELALKYRELILSSLPEGITMEPLMTLYMTDRTTPEEIQRAKESGIVFAVKLYPAGATTNSDSGVTDIMKLLPTLRAMAAHGILLLVHGEVTDQTVDLFDREAEFIERHLRPLVAAVPELKIVMEHITTKQAVDFVTECGPNVGATITCHHLLYNRNAIFKGGLQPHMYCLPVLKRERHRLALVAAATSGSPKFFLGTDSAPHTSARKEACCGCAGVFTAFCAVELYAEAFAKAGALDKLEGFASFHGPDFYGLPRNEARVTLVEEPLTVPMGFDYMDGDTKCTLRPLRAGETVQFTMRR